MPLFYSSGNFYPYVPKQVAQLPFDLMRSSLVTRSPEAIQKALEAERAGTPNPTLVPQKMAFTGWHDTAGYGENVRSMQAALRDEQEKLAAIQSAVRQTPMNPIDQASHADGRNAMPQLASELSPNINNVPVSRGVIPWNQLVSPEQLQTIAAPPMRGMDQATQSAIDAATSSVRPLSGLGDAAADAAQPTTPAPVHTRHPVATALVAMSLGTAVGYAIGIPTHGGRDRQWGGAIGALVGTMAWMAWGLSPNKG